MDPKDDPCSLEHHVKLAKRIVKNTEINILLPQKSTLKYAIHKGSEVGFYSVSMRKLVFPHYIDMNKEIWYVSTAVPVRNGTISLQTLFK